MGLEVDVFNMWEAGHIYMPNVASSYLRANASIAATVEDSREAFVREYGSNQWGPAGDVWCHVRDQIQTNLALSVLDCEEIGKALVAASDAYMTSDIENAVKIRKKSRLDEKNNSKKDEDDQLLMPPGSNDGPTWPTHSE